MLVFGWICMIALMLFGLFILGLLTGPFVISKIKTFGYRLSKASEDEKLDVDKRSEERRRRDEIKRQKDFELANRKLDAKLNKVDKQIKLQTEKLKLAEELKKKTKIEKEELIEIKNIESDNIELSEHIDNEKELDIE